MYELARSGAEHERSVDEKTMPKRKYAIEYALELAVSSWQLLRPAHLHLARQHALKDAASYNTYMILERNRITLDPERFCAQDGSVEGVALEHSATGVVRHPFVAPLLFDSLGAVASTEYPYTEYDIQRDGKSVASGNIGISLANVSESFSHFSDFQVVYIGQAQGRTGERDAIDRLGKHSTLQRILTEVSTERPHKEVWLLLLDFELLTLSQFGPGSATSDFDVDDSIEHISGVDDTIPEVRSQLVTVFEAALIRYFQPSYNKLLKTSFPNEKHTSYEGIYALDISAIAVSIDTHRPSVSLFSEAAPRSAVHTASYPLRNPRDWRDFFDLFPSD